jgi:hypothetical protein
MKRLRHIALIALVIVVQLFIVMQFTLRPVNLAKIPYRQAERAAAMTALAQDQSPENKAAMQQELHLASRHTAVEQYTFTGVVFVALLSFEGVIIYLGRKHETRYKAVA